MGKRKDTAGVRLHSHRKNTGFGRMSKMRAFLIAHKGFFKEKISDFLQYTTKFAAEATFVASAVRYALACSEL